MTFQEYINNPTGTGNSVMSYRKMYEDLYHDKWDKIMVRENGKVDYTLYKKGNTYYCHLKVPSEVVENFYYDVVIKMEQGSKSSLKDGETRFFSNDPSFNYTFAHAFVKNKLHIPELESKMSKKAIKTPAKEKNPQDTIGYVKSLYFAFIMMSEKGLFNKGKYTAEAKSFDKKILLSNITDTDECIEQRIEQEEIQRKKRTKEKEKSSGNKSSKRNEVINPEVKRSFINKITPRSSTSSIRKPGGINKINKKKGHK